MQGAASSVPPLDKDLRPAGRRDAPYMPTDGAICMGLSYTPWHRMTCLWWRPWLLIAALLVMVRADDNELQLGKNDYQTFVTVSSAPWMPPNRESSELTVSQRPEIEALAWNIEVHDERALSPGYWFVQP